MKTISFTIALKRLRNKLNQSSKTWTQKTINCKTLMKETEDTRIKTFYSMHWYTICLADMRPRFNSLLCKQANRQAKFLYHPRWCLDSIYFLSNSKDLSQRNRPILKLIGNHRRLDVQKNKTEGLRLPQNTRQGLKQLMCGIKTDRDQWKEMNSEINPLINSQVIFD